MLTSRFLFGAAAAACTSFPAVAQRGAPFQEFRVDASHSTVEFSIPFLGHVVRGRFDDVQGTMCTRYRLTVRPACPR